MKTTLPLILLALICFSKSYSQEITTKWSDEIEYDTKSLYFNRFIGENEKHVYALYASDTMYTGFAGAKEKKLVVFDKNTLKEIKSTPLLGFSENKTIYKGLEFHTCIIQNDIVMLYWSKINKDSEELYCETFDISLNRTAEIKVIYTNKNAFDLKRALLQKNKTSFVVCQNEKRKDEVLIGREIPISKNYVQFEYGLRVKDSELSQLKSVALPIKLDDQSFGLCSTYEYLENGDVLIRNSFTAEDGKGVTQNVGGGGILITDVNPYFTVSYLKVIKNEISTVELPIYQLTIYSPIIKSVLINNELRFYGLYSNDKKETNEIKGLFCGKFNIDDLINSTEFVEFEQSTLDKLISDFNSKNIFLRDVKVKDNNVIFILGATHVSTGLLNKDISVLGYNLENELNWITTIQTSPYLFSNEIIKGGPNEMTFFYGQKSEKETKENSRSGLSSICYSILNMENGELIRHADFDLGKTLDSRFFKLMNNKLYFIHRENGNMINPKQVTGNIGFLFFE